MRGRVGGGGVMCVYRLRCLMHFCRCFGAAGAALCAVVNGSPRLGHERASSARLEGWLEEWDQWTYIWTRRIFALVSFMAASLLLRCSCCSLSGVQDPHIPCSGYRCDGAVPAVATPDERGSTSSLPARGAARSPRVPQGPPRRARSRTQDGQARHHLGSVRLDLHAE